MQSACGDTLLAERRNLVFHQRNQGGHNNPNPRPTQRRHLKTQAFAAAGRHQHQPRAASRDMADHFFLPAAKGAIAEDAPQGLARGVMHGIHAGAAIRWRRRITQGLRFGTSLRSRARRAASIVSGLAGARRPTKHAKLGAMRVVQRNAAGCFGKCRTQFELRIKGQ